MTLLLKLMKTRIRPNYNKKNDVESQTLAIKETSLQNPEPLRNSFEKMILVANKCCASITPRTVKTKPKKQLTASQLERNGDNSISFLTKTTPTLFGKLL